MSRRTINRDIEDICKAGIPIVTTQGANGGISIMAGFALDTTVFTEQELSAIFAGLKSLDSVSNSASAEKLAQKIGGNKSIPVTRSMATHLREPELNNVNCGMLNRKEYNKVDRKIVSLRMERQFYIGYRRPF